MRALKEFRAQNKTYRDLKAKGAEFLGEPFEPTPGIRLIFMPELNGAVIEWPSGIQRSFRRRLTRERGTGNSLSSVKVL